MGGIKKGKEKNKSHKKWKTNNTRFFLKFWQVSPAQQNSGARTHENQFLKISQRKNFNRNFRLPITKFSRY